MISLTHFIFGLSIAYVLNKRLVTASTFALVPDFDITFNFLYPFVHRGIMHSLLAAVVFSGLVYTYTEDRLSGESAFLGYISHLALDTLTSSGVPLVFPLSNTFSVSLIYASSLEFNSAIIAFSIGLMILSKHQKVFRTFLDIR